MERGGMRKRLFVFLLLSGSDQSVDISCQGFLFLGQNNFVLGVVGIKLFGLLNEKFFCYGNF